MMREAFWYQVALKILDWILEDAWPRALVVVPLVLPLALVKQWQIRSTLKPKGKGSRTTASRPRRTIPILPTWGRWAIGFVWLVVVAGLGWLTYDTHQLRTAAQGLSLAASDTYQAMCLGMKTSTVAKRPVGGVEYLIPSLPNDDPAQFFSALDELAEKGIIYTVPRFNDRVGGTHQPAIPTPFGVRLCTYFLVQ